MAILTKRHGFWVSLRELAYWPSPHSPFLLSSHVQRQLQYSRAPSCRDWISPAAAIRHRSEDFSVQRAARPDSEQIANTVRFHCNWQTDAAPFCKYQRITSNL